MFSRSFAKTINNHEFWIEINHEWATENEVSDLADNIISTLQSLDQDRINQVAKDLYYHCDMLDVPSINDIEELKEFSNSDICPDLLISVTTYE